MLACALHLGALTLLLGLGLLAFALQFRMHAVALALQFHAELLARALQLDPQFVALPLQFGLGEAALLFQLGVRLAPGALELDIGVPAPALEGGVHFLQLNPGQVQLAAALLGPVLEGSLFLLPGAPLGLVPFARPGELRLLLLQAQPRLLLPSFLLIQGDLLGHDRCRLDAYRFDLGPLAHRGLCRRRRQQHTESERAHVEQIAVAQQGRADTLAVDERALGAVQVAQRHLAGARRQHTVEWLDPFDVKADFAARCPTDVHHRPGERPARAAVPSIEDDQLADRWRLVARRVVRQNAGVHPKPPVVPGRLYPYLFIGRPGT